MGVGAAAPCRPGARESRAGPGRPAAAARGGAPRGGHRRGRPAARLAGRASGGPTRPAAARALPPLPVAVALPADVRVGRRAPAAPGGDPSGRQTGPPRLAQERAARTSRLCPLSPTPLQPPSHTAVHATRAAALSTLLCTARAALPHTLNDAARAHLGVGVVRGGARRKRAGRSRLGGRGGGGTLPRIVHPSDLWSARAVLPPPPPAARARGGGDRRAASITGRGGTRRRGQRLFPPHCRTGQPARRRRRRRGFQK